MKEKYKHLSLRILPEDYSYVLFDNKESFSEATKMLINKDCNFITAHLMDEYSLICKTADVQFGYQKIQSDWTGLKIEGEMPFGTVSGLIATISNSLNEIEVGICVVSTYLTDLFLIRTKNLEKAKAKLIKDGWRIS